MQTPTGVRCRRRGPNFFGGSIASEAIAPYQEAHHLDVNEPERTYLVRRMHDLAAHVDEADALGSLAHGFVILTAVHPTSLDAFVEHVVPVLQPSGPSGRWGYRVRVRTPPAEVEITIALIEALVYDQFPELTGEVRIVASGWDNVIARVGDDLCVRLPRRALSAPLVQHEVDWLPQLGPALPVDVPTAVAVGQPGLDYPWTWLICPWFEGRPLANVAVDDRTLTATQLGEFVSALHQSAPGEAPVSPWRGIPLTDIQPQVVERLAQIDPADAASLSAVWSRCANVAPHVGPPSWLHGDLHPLNVLAHSGSTPVLRAVIDWGDLCRGDPATDLAIAWLAFDERGRAAFRAAASSRHPLDDPIWDRGLAWAISLGLLFMLDAEPESAAHGIGAHLLTQLRSGGAVR